MKFEDENEEQTITVTNSQTLTVDDLARIHWALSDRADKFEAEGVPSVAEKLLRLSSDFAQMQWAAIDGSEVVITWGSQVYA